MSKIALMGKYFFDFRCDWIAWGKKINRHVTFYKFWKSVWFFKMELPVQSTRGKMFRKWIHNFNSNITSCCRASFCSANWGVWLNHRKYYCLAFYLLELEVPDGFKANILTFSAKFQGTVRTLSILWAFDVFCPSRGKGIWSPKIQMPEVDVEVSIWLVHNLEITSVFTVQILPMRVKFLAVNWFETFLYSNLPSPGPKSFSNDPIICRFSGDQMPPTPYPRENYQITVLTFQ